MKRRGWPEAPTTALQDRLSTYELRHIVAHLLSAGRAQDVHRLLGLETPVGGSTRNSWYAAKDAAGDLAGFVADVELAWRSVGTTSDASVALQVHYALMSASARSLAGVLPPALIELLVDDGTWSTERAMTYARYVPDAERRAHTLARIARSVHGRAHADAIQEALDAARAVTDGYWRAAAVAEVSRALPGPIPHELREAANSVGDPFWRDALLHLLDADEADDDESPKGDPADSGFTDPKLGANQLLERGLQRERAARWMLAGQLPDVDACEGPRDGESVSPAQSIPDTDARLEALTLLARSSSGARRALLVDEALNAARRLDDTEQATAAAAALGAAEAAAGSVTEALELASAVEDAASSVRILIAVLPHLPRGERRDAATLATQRIQAIVDGEDRDEYLCEVVEVLAQNAITEDVGEIADRIGSRRLRARAWTTIAEHAGESSSTDVAERALALIVDPGVSGWAPPLITRLSEQLSEASLAKLLLAARDVDRELAEACIVPVALAMAARDHHEKARELISKISGVCARETAHAMLAIQQAQAGHRAEAVALAEGLRLVPQRIETRAAIDPKEPHALRSVRSLPEEERAASLLRILPVLSPHSQAACAAEVRRLAAHLPEAARDPTRVDLASVLTERTGVAAALDVALEIGDEELRSKALVKLGRSPRKEEIPILLAAIDDLVDDSLRAGAKTALAGHPELWPVDQLSRTFADILRVQTAQGRKVLLTALTTLAPAVRALGGHSSVRDVADSIGLARRWWP